MGNGGDASPEISKLPLLAQSFGVTTDWLLSEDEPTPEEGPAQAEPTEWFILARKRAGRNPPQQTSPLSRSAAGAIMVRSRPFCGCNHRLRNFQPL